MAAELGVLAFEQGYARWSEGEQEASDSLARHALAALEELGAATAALSRSDTTTTRPEPGAGRPHPP